MDKTSIEAALFKSDKPYLIDREEQTDEFVHFYFSWKYDGRDVIYDVALYTLRLHYQSEVYDMAEEKTARRYPEFEKHIAENDDYDPFDLPTHFDEEIEAFMAETMIEIEEEGLIKVQEFVEYDTSDPDYVGVDAAVNVIEIDKSVIEKFVSDFKSDALQLDPTYYTFDLDEEG